MQSTSFVSVSWETVYTDLWKAKMSLLRMKLKTARQIMSRLDILKLATHSIV